MSSDTTTIRVHASDSAEATREAADLRRLLLDAVPSELEIRLAKDDERTQDLGATLVLAMGTPAVLAVARGLADWIRKRRVGSSIELEINGLRIKATGEVADNTEQIERLITALRK